MDTPPSSDQGYIGNIRLPSGGSPFNAQDALIREIISSLSTAKIVQVKAVTNSGAEAAVGTVDVQPMVNQVDGQGNPFPHGTIVQLPYFRLQGGANAIILDPVVGDIGIAIFSDRDTSVVKKTKKVGNPGSRRQMDWADGFYVGGFLNDTPTQLVRFASDGIHIKSGNGIFLEGNVTVTGNLLASGSVVAGNGGGDQVTLQTHKHPTAAAGAPSSPTPGT